MMKLILTLTLIWALSSTAGALRCETCTNPQCSSIAQQSCSSETKCVTASIQVATSGSATQQILKACASSSLCPATGSQTFSANVGVGSAVASVQCCDTDNCNSATPPFPGVQTNNSLQCFTCTTPECTTSLRCRGVEDRCFQMRVTVGAITTPVSGCASANLCTAAASLASLPFVQNIGNISSGPTCCGSSLCNAAAATVTDVMHLLFGLLVFTLW